MKKVVVKNPVGLHARPAANFCAKAKAFKSDIEVVVNGQSYNGKSLINIMSAGIENNDEIFINATGSDAINAENELVAFIKAMEE